MQKRALVCPFLFLYHAKYYSTKTKDYNSAPKDSLELSLAQDLARAALLLQADNGGIRMSPVGTFHAKGKDWYYNEISTENNLSWYAALRMLYQITKDEKYRKAMDRIEVYLKSVWDKKSNVFYQGAHYTDSSWKPNTAPFATDCQTWAIDVLGPAVIDGWFGEGTAMKMWQKTKELAGYVKDGKLKGVGFSSEHDRLSIEWTAGAILATRILTDYYKTKHPEWATEVSNDAESMRNGIDDYKFEVTPGQSAYAYSSRRGVIPFGWNSHSPDVLSTTSTSWVVLLEKGFNPFILGGQQIPVAPTNLNRSSNFDNRGTGLKAIVLGFGIFGLGALSTQAAVNGAAVAAGKTVMSLAGMLAFAKGILIIGGLLGVLTLAIWGLRKLSLGNRTQAEAYFVSRTINDSVGALVAFIGSILFFGSSSFVQAAGSAAATPVDSISMGMLATIPLVAREIVVGVLIALLVYFFYQNRMKHALNREHAETHLEAEGKEFRMLTAGELRRAAGEPENDLVRDELLKLAEDLDLLVRNRAIAWHYTAAVAFRKEGLEVGMTVDWKIDKGRFFCVLGKDSPEMYMFLRAYLLALVKTQSSEEALSHVIASLEIMKLKPGEVAVEAEEIMRLQRALKDALSTSKGGLFEDSFATAFSIAREWLRVLTGCMVYILAPAVMQALPEELRLPETQKATQDQEKELRRGLRNLWDISRLFISHKFREKFILQTLAFLAW